MKAQRYQRGSLAIAKRKRQPDLWEFRYYTEEQGQTVYRGRRLARWSISRNAEGRGEGSRTTQGRDKQWGGIRPHEHRAACGSLQERGISCPARLTQRWKATQTSSTIASSRSGAAVRCPLSKALRLRSGLLASRGRMGNRPVARLKRKIRNVMSALYTHAIRNGCAINNPITAVRTSAKRLRDPDILGPGEFRALIEKLPLRERAMVLLDASTGLRRGELIALRWQDVDFEEGHQSDAFYLAQRRWSD